VTTTGIAKVNVCPYVIIRYFVRDHDSGSPENRARLVTVDGTRHRREFSGPGRMVHEHAESTVGSINGIM